MAKQHDKTCHLCDQKQAANRPMLSLGELNICFPCIENLDYHMFVSNMGDIAADRVLSLIRGTHPELLPKE